MNEALKDLLQQRHQWKNIIQMLTGIGMVTVGLCLIVITLLLGASDYLVFYILSRIVTYAGVIVFLLGRFGKEE